MLLESGWQQLKHLERDVQSGSSGPGWGRWLPSSAGRAFLPQRGRAPGLVVCWLPPCLRQLGARAECLPSASFHTGVEGSVHTPLFHNAFPHSWVAV